MKTKDLALTIGLTAFSLALTITTLIFAPLPLMLIRRNLGRRWFGLGFVLGGVFLAFVVTPSTLAAFLGAGILAFVLSEGENQNLGFTSSVFITLLIITGLTAIGVGFSVHQYGFNPFHFLQEQVRTGISKLALPTGVTIDQDAVVKQLPSALVIIVIFSIWANALLVNRAERMLGWTKQKLKHSFQRGEFQFWKLPDFIVWIALLSAAGAFLDVKPEWLRWLSTNIFNVMVLLYFFQGLAVIVNFFETKRVSPLWRIIGYGLIFSQLFLMVSVVGFADFWLAFRDRKKTDKSAVA